MTSSDIFPTRIVQNSPGERGLVAVEPLETGAIVARFEGPVVRWADLPPSEIRHALLLQDDDWMLPQSDARFLNHSCAPNCRVADDLGVVTLRTVAAGEELTISYDALSMAEFVRAPNHYFWDERWSFDCRCGAPECVGRVDRYRLRGYEGSAVAPAAARLRIGPSPGRGRGVFATGPIPAGEVFERAPVLVSDAAEWPQLEQTILYHYSFAWGPQLEHAAIGLGFASLYNHSYEPNAVYVRQLDQLLLHFIALRAIAAGEEITVNYNNNPLDRQPVWFEVK